MIEDQSAALRVKILDARHRVSAIANDEPMPILVAPENQPTFKDRAVVYAAMAVEQLDAALEIVDCLYPE